MKWIIGIQMIKKRRKKYIGNKHDLKLLFHKVGGKNEFQLEFQFCFHFGCHSCECYAINVPSWKNCCFWSSFMRKLLLFAQSLLSFANNQHSEMKKNFKMKEGPKDRVILTITLICNQWWIAKNIEINKVKAYKDRYTLNHYYTKFGWMASLGFKSLLLGHMQLDIS
jgi:hypothetical protein